MLNRQSSLANRLAHFFDEFASPELHEADEYLGAHKVDALRLTSLFERWRDPLRKSRDAAFTNPWVTAGLGHDEVRICSVLASLWDRNRYGAEAQAFLSRFLQASVGEIGFESGPSENYRIQTENCLNGKINDRVDITVETDTAIIGIEVKVYASERDAQLSDYTKAIAKRAELMRRKIHRVIFLSPYTSRYDDHSVPHITWSELAETASHANGHSHSGWLIQQFGEFCRSLGR